VTGAAGFIGSHLCETLLKLNQKVIGLDNFSTGHRSNLEGLQKSLQADQKQNFHFIEGDINQASDLDQALEGVDVVLHNAAIGSVPRSIEDPMSIHQANVTGFLQLLWSCQQKKIKRIVYASSSAVYGNEPTFPKVEEKLGDCLSPYAASKAIDEIYAQVFARCYGMELIGIRYFNVFGPRQDPNGPYAAVIPKWIQSMAKEKTATIFGDGKTTRDFAYIDNIVQVNLLAAYTKNPKAIGQVFNAACGESLNLNELFVLIRNAMAGSGAADVQSLEPKYEAFRPGDIPHSLADISKAKELLGYEPTHSAEVGLKLTVERIFSEEG
jgi:UDP-N-acetylglucosamine/UDP-N-acetylgalactosamine 4-epimerase